MSKKVKRWVGRNSNFSFFFSLLPADVVTNRFSFWQLFLSFQTLWAPPNSILLPPQLLLSPVFSFPFFFIFTNFLWAHWLACRWGPVQAWKIMLGECGPTIPSLSLHTIYIYIYLLVSSFSLEWSKIGWWWWFNQTVEKEDTISEGLIWRLVNDGPCKCMIIVIGWWTAGLHTGHEKIGLDQLLLLLIMTAIQILKPNINNH